MRCRSGPISGSILTDVSVPSFAGPYSSQLEVARINEIRDAALAISQSSGTSVHLSAFLGLHGGLFGEFDTALLKLSAFAGDGDIHGYVAPKLTISLSKPVYEWRRLKCSLFVLIDQMGQC